MSANGNPKAPAPRQISVEMSPTRGVQLMDIDALYRFATMVSKSGMYTNWKTPEQVAVAVQMGLELGLTPVRSLWAFYSVKGGTPQLKGEAALAIIRASKCCEEGSVDCGDDADGGWFEFFRKGDKLRRVTYTYEEAKQVGLLAKWKTSRQSGGKALDSELIMWRAVARGCRRYLSDVLHGIGIREEAQDWQEYRQARNVTPQRPQLEAPKSKDPLFANGAPDRAAGPADVVARAEQAAEEEETTGCPGCGSAAECTNGKCPDCGFAG